MSKFENYPTILQEALSNNYDLATVAIDIVNEREKELLVQIATTCKIVIDHNWSDDEWRVGEMFRRINSLMAFITTDCGKNPQFCFVVLHMINSTISHKHMKYQNTNIFLSVYPRFVHYDEKDVKTLCRVANWMVILFNLIPAKKNKGLILAAVTKFVEGPGVNYITGSGQTSATADRVFIYETEGNVKPTKRIKLDKNTTASVDTISQSNKNEKVKKKQKNVKDFGNNKLNVKNVQQLDPNNATLSMLNVPSFKFSYDGRNILTPRSFSNSSNYSLRGYSATSQRNASTGLPEDVLNGLGMGKDSSWNFPWPQPLTSVKCSSLNVIENQLLMSGCNESLEVKPENVVELPPKMQRGISLVSADGEISSTWRDKSIDNITVTDDVLKSLGVSRDASWSCLNANIFGS